MNVIPYFQLSVIFLSFPKSHPIPWRCSLSVLSCPSSVINQCFTDFPVCFRILSRHSLIAFVAISLSPFKLYFCFSFLYDSSLIVSVRKYAFGLFL